MVCCCSLSKLVSELGTRKARIGDGRRLGFNTDGVNKMTAAATQLDLANFIDESKAGSEEMKLIRAYKKDSEEQGGLVTQGQARGILGVSSTRMCQLIDAGTLQGFEHFKTRLIGVNQLIEYARLQKVDGGTGAMLLRSFKAHWQDRKKVGK